MSSRSLMISRLFSSSLRSNHSTLPGLALQSKSFHSSQNIRSSTSDDNTLISKSPSTPTLQADLISIRPGQLYRSRLAEYYNDQLASDLLYMTYQLPAGHALDGSTPHQPDGRALTDYPDPMTKVPKWDPNDPYTRNRPPKPPKGGSGAIPRRAPPDSSPEHLVKLLKVALDIHVPEAIHTKKELLGAIYLLELITGQPDRTGLSSESLSKLTRSSGIHLCRTKDASTTFKVRRGMVCGARVELKGPKMYSFLDVLTTFVLPRLKDFNGFSLPPPDAHRRHTAMVSGVVQVGLPDHAMGLWPGVEESLENWPRKYGMNIHFITNATGPGASEKARALMSGFRVPFVRPEDAKLKR
ncbi:hypothetical protein O181_065330 [Austropuccinia psidii MF-1]|uniref:Large ribosomal subunit protein uL5 C-terminal domain-containing protein n=1 Tax=Austropuccinia psidii MF-1 TaxID=1389203 RepID=A0A9Q3EM21_9BASI|nr:hypothetical protein [Austropuccinia psidii MF-1]